MNSMHPYGSVVGEWSSSSARVVLLEAERGFELHRDTCPHTQYWLLLRGHWTEKTPKAEREIVPSEVRVYSPKFRCEHVCESRSLALSLEMKVDVRQQTSSQDAMVLYRLAHAAKKGQLGPLHVEELSLPLSAPLALRYEARLPRWLCQARDILHDRVGEDFDLTELAEAVGITPNHLSTTFTKFFGSSISAYQRRNRMLRAISLARRGRSAGELPAWAEAGFHDAAHFWRTCCQELGMSPSEVRALWN
jgi:AraC-like DNA-binding protein